MTRSDLFDPDALPVEWLVASLLGLPVTGRLLPALAAELTAPPLPATVPDDEAAASLRAAIRSGRVEVMDP